MLVEARNLGRRRQSNQVTRERIILAAESLFARFGIEATSLRQIASDAGQKNTNAVTYHFGDKNLLVSSIFEYRTNYFEPIRQKMIDKANKEEIVFDVRLITRIFFLPYLLATTNDGRHSYASFLNHYISHSRLAGVPYIYDEGHLRAPAFEKLRALLEQRLETLPKFLIRPRIQAAVISFTGALIRWDSEIAGGKHSVPLDVLVSDVLEQISLALCSPYREPAEKDAAQFWLE